MPKVQSPWDSAEMWAVWLVLLVIATLFIHNGMEIYKRKAR